MKTKRGDQSGVALIIVLGLLSMLLLLAFSFAVQMRTDSKAAMAYFALQRTEPVLMQAIQLAALEASHYTPGSERYYPQGEFANSRYVLPGPWRKQDANSITDYFQGEAARYIPAAVLDPVLLDGAVLNWGIIASSYDNQHTEAIPPHRTWMAAVDFEPSGAYYYIVNCSGYLDANVVGRTDRFTGNDAAEIQLENVIKNEKLFRGSSATFKSLPELRYYLDKNQEDVPEGEGSTAEGKELFIYSAFPVAEYWDKGKNKMVRRVSLRGDEQALADREAEIRDAFVNAGTYRTPDGAGGYTLPGDRELTIAGWLFTNLLDYVDSDNVPKILHAPSVEPVPGFNEIAVETVYSCECIGPTNYQFTVQTKVHFELWDPYIVDQSQMAVAQTYLMDRAEFTFQPKRAPAGIGRKTTRLPRNSSFTLKRRNYAVLSVGFEEQVKQDKWDDNENEKRELIYEIGIPEMSFFESAGRGAASTDPLDGIQAVTLTFTNRLARRPNGVGARETNGDRFYSVECMDPRFNWDVSKRGYWVRRTNHSLSNLNAVTRNYIEVTGNNRLYRDYGADDAEGTTDANLPKVATNTWAQMFCANQDIRAVGEVGYLPYAPLKTVRLYDPEGKGNYHRVLDTFTLKTNEVARGLVNPNTCHSNVLAAVFNRMWIDQFPGDTNGFRLGWTQAMDLSTNIIWHTYGVTPPLAVTSKVDNIRDALLNTSEIGDVKRIFGSKKILGAGRLSADSIFKREAILRNSSELFSTRQTLFTLFVGATAEQPYGREVDGATTGTDFNIRGGSAGRAEKRAVVVYWRDPWPVAGSDGVQRPKQFIRFLKILDSPTCPRGFKSTKG